jgi:hypothetical protein
MAAGWLAAGSGRHERGLGGGVATTTSATGGRCQRPVRRRGWRTGAGPAGQRDEPQRWWMAGVLGDRGHHQERVGQHGQDHPPVPGAPAADLVLVQAAQPLAGRERLLHPPTSTPPPGPGRPAAGRPGRRTPSRPAPRCAGCGGPAASAATRTARRWWPAAGGPTPTSGDPWHPGRHSAAASTPVGHGRPAAPPARSTPTVATAARWP